MMLSLRKKQDGKPLGFGDALLRYFGTIISSIILGIGYLMIAFDDRKRRLHDIIADQGGIQRLRNWHQNKAPLLHYFIG